MLEKSDLTPYEYRSQLSFFMGGLSDASISWHQATIADLADYALRKIFDTDVGFRSCDPPKIRDAAIEAWRKIAHQHGDDGPMEHFWAYLSGWG
jgi:hypothetical protein